MTDDIQRQARAAADADQPPEVCPYALKSSEGKRWMVAYWHREMELHRTRLVSTFAFGACEQMVEVRV